MTILVTGGAGYIGSHCVQHLMSHGHSVVVFDDLSTGYERFVLSPHFVKGNTRDKALLVKTIQDFHVTAVMHFAASCYVGESVNEPGKYYGNNVYGTLQLLDAMRETKVSQLVFSSTCATYGVPQTLPLTEEHPLNPISPYGKTKRIVEMMMEDYSLAYGLNYVALRYFNAAGADSTGKLGEAHEPETHLIPLVLQTATGKRKNIQIFGTDYDTPDGTCIRDYIHIVDIAEAHRLALTYLTAGNSSDVFNLGTGHGFSVREIIQACEQITGKPIAVVEAPRRPGDPAKLVANAAKANKVLGWKPAFGELTEIIRTAWQWEQQVTELPSLSR
ncbi:MAG: UDP-glucose 4-epimerase GalE [Vampirovibrio sp.]|nr:UDP-glucose 4-epimerase GalE [Vampirovibrio sp.]